MGKESKEKIVIVNSNLHIGGVQRALINLLKCVHSKYDITLVLFNSNGELVKEIPDDIKVIPIVSDYKFLGLNKYDVEYNLLMKWKRNFYALITKYLGRDTAISLMALRQDKLSGYDVAISYIHNGSDTAFYGGCNDFVLRHIEASKKVTFLHCDYKLCGANTLKNKKKYMQFDMIAACSQGCRNNFLEKIPELTDKTKVIYNCQDYEMIKTKAGAFNVELASEKVNIVTIARLGKEKGVPRAIEAIGESNMDRDGIHYYIVGDGIEKAIVEEKIKYYGLEKVVTLLGELKNPYPYIKAADLLLISSYSEGAPMVIGEAAYLGVPVLSTETSSAKEMIVDTDFGWVCNNSVKGITEVLSELVVNKEILDEKKIVLRKKCFDNNVPVNQFEMLLHK